MNAVSPSNKFRNTVTSPHPCQFFVFTIQETSRPIQCVSFLYVCPRYRWSNLTDFTALPSYITRKTDCVWNVMVHAQKPDFVFRRNGRVHLNRRGRQFSRLQAAEVCALASAMLVTPRSEVVWECWLPTPFASFSFTSPPVRHRVPSGFKRTLQIAKLLVLLQATVNS